MHGRPIPQLRAPGMPQEGSPDVERVEVFVEGQSLLQVRWVCYRNGVMMHKEEGTPGAHCSTVAPGVASEGAVMHDDAFVVRRRARSEEQQGGQLDAWKGPVGIVGGSGARITEAYEG